jgi:thiol-disulfide isomerase/thioredoxin
MGRLFNIIKPILTVAVIIVVLKMTGAMSSVSYFTNSALLKTGIMDATSGNQSGYVESFDYNFNIKTLAGETVDFTQFKGKVVFINLWATWCGPCRAEMPSIQKLYDQIDKEKIKFVILSLDNDEDLPKIIKYVDKYDYSFPVYQPKGFLPSQLSVPSIPTTFIIDPNGNIVSKKVGATNFNTGKFKKYLEGLAE